MLPHLVLPLPPPDEGNDSEREPEIDVDSSSSERPEPEPRERRPVVDALDASDHLLKNHDWGPFRITYRPPKGPLALGAWFARCPFHKLSEKTDCTRTSTIGAPDDGSRTAALRSLYMWCNSARSFDTKAMLS